MKKGIRTTKQDKARKKHGFIARMSSHNGRKVLQRRRNEGRARLTV